MKVEITSLVGSRLNLKPSAEAVSFDIKVKLEERERRSQMVTIGFGLLLTAKPSIVKFEVEGSAVLTGKDEDIRKMLEVDAETKIPHVLPRIYQHAFMTMYLLSTVLNTPPPPQDLLSSQKQTTPVENVSVQIGSDASVSPSGEGQQPPTEPKQG